MKSVLYIGGLTANEKGAVGVHTSGILKALEKKLGASVQGVFYSFAQPAYSLKRVIIFDAPIPLGIFYKIWIRISYIRFVNALLKNKKFDLIYTRFDPFVTPFIRKNGARMAIEYNDIFMDQIKFVVEKGEWTGLNKKIRSSWLYENFILSAEKKSFFSADRVVCVTSALVDYCDSVSSSKKGLLIENASDVDYYNVKELVTYDDDQLIMSHIGTLTYWDGLEPLINALYLCKMENSDFKFRFNIVGSGAVYNRIRLLCNKYDLNSDIQFSPPVIHSEAVRYLKNTDVVPLLKDIDTYGLSPIKFYESIAMGCFIIASDIPHINNFPDYVGMVVSYPLDEGEISNALYYAFKNKKLIRERKEKVLEYAHANHAWDSRVKTLLEAFQLE